MSKKKQETNKLDKIRKDIAQLCYEIGDKQWGIRELGKQIDKLRADSSNLVDEIEKNQISIDALRVELAREEDGSKKSK